MKLCIPKLNLHIFSLIIRIFRSPKYMYMCCKKENRILNIIEVILINKSDRLNVVIIKLMIFVRLDFDF